jgi:hypothetical protein
MNADEQLVRSLVTLEELVKHPATKEEMQKLRVEWSYSSNHCWFQEAVSIRAPPPPMLMSNS